MRRHVAATGRGDGLDLPRRVRALHPRLPVVFHPTGGSEALASEAIGARVTDYVPRSGENGDRPVEAVAGAIAAEPNRPEERVSGIMTVRSALVGAQAAGDVAEVTSIDTETPGRHHASGLH